VRAEGHEKGKPWDLVCQNVPVLYRKTEKGEKKVNPQPNAAKPLSATLAPFPPLLTPFPALPAFYAPCAPLVLPVQRSVQERGGLRASDRGPAPEGQRTLSRERCTLG